MRNLNIQLCVPYQPCPFKCPTCIASGNNDFKNLYDKDKNKYFKRLAKVLKKYKGDIILTGATEPTLNEKWLKEVVYFIRDNFCDRHIELQTHNLNDCALDKTYNNLFDVISYSLTKPEDVKKLFNKDYSSDGWHRHYWYQKNYTTRFVILGTKENFNCFLKDENLSKCPVHQITIKKLQYSKDEKVNKYIDEHKVSMREFELIKFRADSLRYDSNCQESKNRYRVFREDGKLYKGW